MKNYNVAMLLFGFFFNGLDVVLFVRDFWLETTLLILPSSLSTRPRLVVAGIATDRSFL
jgi:hypothetical protein